MSGSFRVPLIPTRRTDPEVAVDMSDGLRAVKVLPSLAYCFPAVDLFAAWTWLLALVMIYGMRGFAIYNRIVPSEDLFGKFSLYDKLVVHGCLLICSIYAAFRVRQWFRMVEVYWYWDKVFFEYLSVDTWLLPILPSVYRTLEYRPTEEVKEVLKIALPEFSPDQVDSLLQSTRQEDSPKPLDLRPQFQQIETALLAVQKDLNNLSETDKSSNLVVTRQFLFSSLQELKNQLIQTFPLCLENISSGDKEYLSRKHQEILKAEETDPYPSNLLAEMNALFKVEAAESSANSFQIFMALWLILQ